MRRFDGDRLLVATHNRGKLEEIADLLAPYGLAITSNADHGLPEPEETGTTFVQNARIKAHAACRATGLPALSDDSGLEIDALGGRPGVWTADWAETGRGRDFGMAMERAHRELIASGAAQPWQARFCCTLVLAWPDGHDEVYPGTMEGRIVWPMRGRQGHGYDPVFQPDGYDQTFGEMDRWEKNRISHRADAFARLIAGSFA
ncbi:RdgB/HAM1 family non-canonical purine NTP pyrophosphatase [Palleronia rufa]|uniref:RdgB/HAM1 family non-canonical purine NTP pyrophosphatase n=1 Tax=Palleronia rufa TaxID=1530186 RepID=UPI00055B7003|nr:RdgB/HAM1 family non-canonical purine NTP pyrophosphatase [Palleronia rufa]